MSISELANYLDNKGCLLLGCTPKEISKIEEFFNIQLPSTYREFLYSMGKSAGDFMQGSTVFYKEIFDLKEASSRILEDDEFRPLPADAFVFWMHQGYQFAFFILTEGDDPPIYFYQEGTNRKDFDLKETSLSIFLEKQLILSGLRTA